MIGVCGEDGQVAYSFEVEYTTAITNAFMRCSAIPESHQTRRFILIPEERVEKEGWKLILFKHLRVLE